MFYASKWEKRRASVVHILLYVHCTVDWVMCNVYAVTKDPKRYGWQMADRQDDEDTMTMMMLLLLNACTVRKRLYVPANNYLHMLLSTFMDRPTDLYSLNTSHSVANFSLLKHCIKSW